MTQQEVMDKIFLALADIWDTEAKRPVIEDVSMLHKLKEPLFVGLRQRGLLKLDE